MGKEKETFESWRKPIRGRKVITQKEASEDPRRVEGRQQRSTEKMSVPRPRGMKKTAISDVADGRVEDIQEDLHNGTEIVGMGSQGSTSHAPEKRMEVGRHVVAVDQITNAAAKVPTKRPGKERAQTPTSSEGNMYFPPPQSERLTGRQRRKSSLQRCDSSDSFIELPPEPSRRRGRVKRRGRRYSVESTRNVSSESPKEVSRSNRGGLEEYHRRGKDPKSGQRRRRRGGRREVSSTEGENYNGSDEERLHRRKLAKRNISPEYERFRKSKRDYSHDDEQSGDSLHDGRDGKTAVQVKAEKDEAESDRGETRKRKERRRRQTDREIERSNHERQGLKAHYLSVNQMGIPYGFGVGAWRTELTKLSQGLDPSVTDVRCHPEDVMATLRRRLKDHFEYSAAVDRTYIRKLVGKVVTQRRSRLLNSMKDGDDCPSGFDVDIWRPLERIRKDPNREELSQRMKYANAARVNKGRTRPKGEDGTREDLQRKLGREPYLDEVQFEMRRKEGYDGVSRRRKTVKSRKLSPCTDEEDEEDEEAGIESTDVSGGGRLNITKKDRDGPHREFEMDAFEKMKKELEELRSKMRAVKNSRVPEAVEYGGPSSSVRIGGPVSHATTVDATDVTNKSAEDDGLVPMEDINDFRTSPPKKKLRSSKKQ